MTLFSRIPTLAAAALVTSLGALPAGAHHSTAAFDNSHVIKIEGTIKQFPGSTRTPRSRSKASPKATRPTAYGPSR